MNKVNISKKLKDGEYYKYDSKKGFIAIDPKDIIYKSHTIDNLEKYYKSFISLKNEVEKYQGYLSKSLKGYDIDIDDENIEYTIEKAIHLLDILTTKVNKLNTFKINENGLCEHFSEGQYIITKDSIKVPHDLNNGYYRVFINTKGKIEIKLDETKYQEEMM